MKYIKLLLVIVIPLLVSSCATILTGTTQRITIDSEPQGADIIIDGRIIGTTPAKVRLDRDINAFIENGKEIYLEMDGYYADGYFLGTDIEPTYVLNVFCFPFGFAADALTGALMRYDSDYYNFRLAPVKDLPKQPLQSKTSPVSRAQQPPTTANDASDEEGEMDNYEKLMKLIEAYEAGHITEEEFEAQKKVIFDKNR